MEWAGDATLGQMRELLALLYLAHGPTLPPGALEAACQALVQTPDSPTPLTQVPRLLNSGPGHRTSQPFFPNMLSGNAGQGLEEL